MEDEPVSDLIVIEWYDDVADANRTAATLVEHGMGAVLDETAPPRTGVAVLGADAARARELLGLVEVDESTGEDELRSMSRSWLVPALIFAAALLLVPLIAFFVSFKLSGG